MRVTTVLTKLLCLQGAFVGKVEFGVVGVVVGVAKRHRPNRRPRCPFSTPVAGINARVHRVHLLEEELRGPCRCRPRSAFCLRSWLSRASRSNLAPFVKLDHTLRQDRDGVPEPIRPGLSNRRLEGLNNKIGVIKHRAYGFDSFAAFAAMVFLCSVALQLKLPICVKKAKTASIETRSGHQDR